MTHTTTRLSFGLAMLLLPAQVLAALQLSVSDSIAGLGTTLEARGLSASQNVQISLTDPTGRTDRWRESAGTDGTLSTEIGGEKSTLAGVYEVAVVDGTQVLGKTSFSVTPESMDPWTSELQVWTPRIAADGHDEAEITVTVYDRHGNPLADRPVALISSRAEDEVTAVTPQTDSEGVQHFTLATTLPGTAQVRALDLLSGNTIIAAGEVKAGDPYAVGNNYAPPSRAANTGRIYYAQTAMFDVIDHFEITAPANLASGQEADVVTITAVDVSGNIVEDYTGTIRFGSTDSRAVFPSFGTAAFRPGEAGVKKVYLGVRFNTAGCHMLVVEDINDSSIQGSTQVSVDGGCANDPGPGPVDPGPINPFPPAQIIVTSHADGDYINDTQITLSGQAQPYSNLRVMGGIQDATGASDALGNYAIMVDLNPAQRDFTIRVQDESGQSDSGPLHLILDQEEPEIGTITFAPERPEEGEKTLVAVESEPDLAQILLRIPTTDGDTQEVTLAENATAKGTYQAFFTAPAADTYQPTVVAMDRAGNVAEVRSVFAVGFESLPLVENIRAEPRVNAIALEWDTVDADVEGYRVYVGETEDDFLYTLDTERVTNKATVAGLAPGKTYYFAVTAVNGDAESEKGEIVESKVLGLTLTVTPQDGALNVKWSALSSDVPLSTYLLEYGTEKDTYTEKRILNGQLRDFTIRDLLNDVAYYIKLTPVTVTQDPLADIAATGEGTPVGKGGFKPAARDDIPFDASTHPGAPLNDPPPRLSEEGLPAFAWMLAVALGALAVVYRWHRRNAMRRSAAFLRAIEAQYRVN